MALSLVQIFVPKKRPNPKGTAYTSTFNPTQRNTPLGVPALQQHLQDIFDQRVSQNSRELMKNLFRNDPDMSATVNAYLSLANTQPRFYVYDAEGVPDPEGQRQLENLLNSLFIRNDYTTGFQMAKSIAGHCENFRYEILLTGGLGGEMIFDKTLLPVEIRHVNLNEVEWLEPEPGVFKPVQKPAAAGGTEISLDIPNFIVKYFRQNPFEAYPQSGFISAINTIAARMQVVNDLYRIMQRVGYPRIEVTILEEVLRKNAPASIRADENELIRWMNERITEIANGISNLRPDQAYVHMDSIEPKVLNDGGPGKSMDVESIIKVLNAQNQAGMKSMASIIGRGETGVNTATVEARIFSISAQELNVPIADFFSEALTLAMRMGGYPGYVVCEFDPVEMRSETELEAQLTMRQSRLMEALSLGAITDDEFHLWMFFRPRPPSAPMLSGTNFREMGKSPVDAGGISPNSDPLGRSVSSSADKSAKSNGVSSS